MNTRVMLAIVTVVFVGVLGYGYFTLPTRAASVSTPQTVNVNKSASGYTLAEVAKHADASSCFAAINGKVYDLTSWINQHPGGAERILSICGTDGSAAFNNQHGGQGRPERELANFYIGALAN